MEAVTMTLLFSYIHPGVKHRPSEFELDALELRMDFSGEKLD